MEEKDAEGKGFRLSCAAQLLIAGAAVLLFLSAAVPALIRFMEGAK